MKNRYLIILAFLIFNVTKAINIPFDFNSTSKVNLTSDNRLSLKQNKDSILFKNNFQTKYKNNYSHSFDEKSYDECSIDFSMYTGGSYLSNVNKSVNFRKGPSTSCPIITTLGYGSQVFVLSSEGTNGYYPAIDLNTNNRGFIYKSYVTLGKYYAPSSKPMFNKSGNITTYQSEIVVYNNTSKRLSLDLGSTTHKLYSQERKTIHVSPGSLFYLASAPGVLPAKGTQKFESNSTYSWEFYIQTTRQ